MKLICSLFMLVLTLVLTNGCTQNLLTDFNDELALNSQEIVVNSQSLLVNSNDNVVMAGEKNHKISFNSKFTVWSDPPPPGSGYLLTICGSGTATRMGRSRLVIQETITTIPDTEPWKAVAEVIITAANGDELYFSCTSAVDRSETPVMVFNGICEVKGGSGAFENAKGVLEYNGSRSWETGLGSATFAGEILF